MADTVTPKLGLTKPEIGASNNTWGTKVNENFNILDGKVIFNTAQWHMALGDGVADSPGGPFIITRYSNTTLPIDNPLTIDRQTGEVFVPSLKANSFISGTTKLSYQSSSPATPVAGNANIFINAQGHPVIQRPDGSIEYLGVPPGTIAWTGAGTPDVGWAFLNGQSLARALYPVLFSRFSTAFGTPVDGNSFNLPDVRGRVIAHVDGGMNRLLATLGAAALGAVGGLDTHVLTWDQMPMHRHEALIHEDAHHHAYNEAGGGAAKVGGTGSNSWTNTFPNNTEDVKTGVQVNNSDGGGLDVTGQSGGSVAHPNVQPTIVLNAQVKLG